MGKEGGDDGQVGGGAHLPRGSGSKASPGPVYPQCHPRDQKSETAESCLAITETEAEARAKAAMPWVGARAQAVSVS